MARVKCSLQFILSVTIFMYTVSLQIYHNNIILVLIKSLFKYVAIIIIVD